MAVPDDITALVQRFRDNEAAYTDPHYNETQLRREFIDPMFRALGWDVDNSQGYAEAYKDVIHEDAIRIGGGTKAPDYCFRIGGTRKFFLEAKKPSVNIRDDLHPAYQLRRYAWSAKLPLSILTDFQEFAVYDCRVKPEKLDKPSTARILFLTYQDYPERWDEIAGYFAKDAVLKGSFDRFADANKGKRGTATVDDAFLAEIQAWRESLAKHLALRNPKLTPRELNYAVQTTIDRLIFLRICEDRAIEVYGQLQALLGGGRVYPRLLELFRKADDRYNSGLFHFHTEKDRQEPPDELTPGLVIEDQPLHDIIRNLYYPDSPYEFSVLPADILGQVYEQFLGQVIRLTAGHQAKVEDKPEVKKAGGVYYTPTYIVDYIVQQTVGKLLDGKTPKKATGVTVLDPACGSGSFLLGAYQYLLDWYLKQYLADDPDKWAKGKAPRLVQVRNGEWKLTTAERKRILLEHIYGVDIDPQAVEVTKLSLLLKVLEGETHQTLWRQLELLHDRALPDLSRNIKCGNSLIGPDFYQNQQLELFDDEARYRINAFDWHAEFPAIFQAGGFAAVIGNPPYVRMEELTKVKDYLRRYQAFEPRADLYTYFIEKETSLLRTGGRLGMIVSNKWIKARYGGPLRLFLAHNLRIHDLIDFGELRVFVNASTFPCIIVASIQGPNASREPVTFRYVPIRELKPAELSQQVASEGFTVSEGPKHMEESWRLARASALTRLLTYPTGFVPLAAWLGKAVIGWGIKTGLNEAFILTEGEGQKWLKANPNHREVIKPLLIGDEIRRYATASPARYLLYAGRGLALDRFPHIKTHLDSFRGPLSKRATVGTHPWYELQQPQPKYAEMFEQEKIAWPEIAKEPRFTIVGPGLYLNNKCFFTDCNSRYMLGILNSRLAWGMLKLMCSCLGDVNKGGRLELRQQYLVRLPVPETPDQSRHDRMLKLVEKMLALHQDLRAAKTAHEKTALQRQLDATDREIDALVYELYGLTADEIKLVEESAGA